MPPSLSSASGRLRSLCGSKRALTVAIGAASAVVLRAGPARAQMADSLASVSYERYLDSDGPRTDGTKDRGRVSLDVFRFRAGLPIPLTESKKTILIPGLNYELLNFHLRGQDGPNVGTLHAP